MSSSRCVSRLCRFGVAGCVVLFTLVAGMSVHSWPVEATPKKEPPACAAISFRPLVMGMADGIHEAGLYRSRFTRMELLADVKDGLPRAYFLHINGQRLESVAAPIPREAEGCLKSKHVRVPVIKQEDACTGNRFRAVIHNGVKQKLAMLFSLQGNEWHLCSTANI
ncbi:MAG: hypothetical protein FD153_776 [Rhodospirillaceae bacterium]|nr:MAG: hypothetical protein FD153_776 [Rhodospirillaceae bacterium]